MKPVDDMCLTRVTREINEYLTRFGRDKSNGAVTTGAMCYRHGSGVVITYRYRQFQSMSVDECRAYLKRLRDGLIGRHDGL